MENGPHAVVPRPSLSERSPLPARICAASPGRSYHLTGGYPAPSTRTGTQARTPLIPRRTDRTSGKKPGMPRCRHPRRSRHPPQPRACPGLHAWSISGLHAPSSPAPAGLPGWI